MEAWVVDLLAAVPLSVVIVFYLLWIRRRQTWLAPRKPAGPIGTTVGHLILFSAACFALYNLFTLATAGTIYSLARGGSSGWIEYANAPLAFVFWTSIYSLPVIIALLLAWGQLEAAKAARRAAFREFVDGTGPPGVLRQSDQR